MGIMDPSALLLKTTPRILLLHFLLVLILIVILITITDLSPTSPSSPDISEDLLPLHLVDKLTCFFSDIKNLIICVTNNLSTAVTCHQHFFLSLKFPPAAGVFLDHHAKVQSICSAAQPSSLDLFSSGRSSIVETAIILRGRNACLLAAMEDKLFCSIPVGFCFQPFRFS